jgi:DNA-directed RNA polymerase subunit M
MKFCDYCGEMLLIIDGVYSCSKCGSEELISDGSYEVKREKTETKKVYVKNDYEEVPAIKISCPKCNNDRATVSVISTGMGVSLTTQKYTCTLCNHSWR